MKFIDNDTIALICLGTVSIIGVLLSNTEVVLSSLGAIGGYIGGKALNK